MRDGTSDGAATPRRDQVSKRFSRLNRRDVIKAGVFGSAALALPIQQVVSARSALTGRMASSKLPKPFTIPFVVPPVAQPYKSTDTGDFYKIRMQKVNAEIIPGYQTPVYAYGFETPNSPYLGTVPGPTIKARQGRRVTVRHVNNLPPVHETLGYQQWTSVHLHGAASLPQFDGYASDVTRPGQYKDYIYENLQHARTLWYHDHGVHHTAENVYHGLLAMYWLSDTDEQSLPLPKGDYDLPIILGDAMFKSDGQLLFSLADDSGMYGDVITVNGKPWPVLKVKRRKYRFRILNGCVSRSFKYSLDTGDLMTVIATDAGLVPSPQKVKEIRHGNAERYEVVIDFAKYPPGKRVVLRNSSPKNNENYVNTDKIMAFDVVADAFDESNNSVPDVLGTDNECMNLTVDQAVAQRTFRFQRQGGEWTINERTWEDIVDSNFQFVEASVNHGDVEMWTLRNDSGGWFHPAHIHLIDFKIVDRNGKPPFAYERGPKDVVYLGENEVVRVLATFDGYGKYMMHCHNLVHEDHDMMTQFEVVAADNRGDDPLGTPCKDEPEDDDF
jgi:FtsP/CotA-like multicopper oxidase with cupredoxin domain